MVQFTSSNNAYKLLEVQMWICVRITEKFIFDVTLRKMNSTRWFPGSTSNWVIGQLNLYKILLPEILELFAFVHMLFNQRMAVIKNCYLSRKSMIIFNFQEFQSDVANNDYYVFVTVVQWFVALLSPEPSRFESVEGKPISLRYIRW